MEGAQGTTLHKEILQRNMSVFLITEWFLTLSQFGKKPSIYLNEIPILGIKTMNVNLNT